MLENVTLSLIRLWHVWEHVSWVSYNNDIYYLEGNKEYPMANHNKSITFFNEWIFIYSAVSLR